MPKLLRKVLHIFLVYSENIKNVKNKSGWHKVSWV